MNPERPVTQQDVVRETLTNWWVNFAPQQPETAEVSPGGVLMCPVDGCQWRLGVPEPTCDYEWSDDGWPVAGVRRGVDPATVEAALMEHLGAHDALDYLRTINRLHGLLAEKGIRS